MPPFPDSSWAAARKTPDAAVDHLSSGFRPAPDATPTPQGGASPDQGYTRSPCRCWGRTRTCWGSAGCTPAGRPHPTLSSPGLPRQYRASPRGGRPGRWSVSAANEPHRPEVFSIPFQGGRGEDPQVRTAGAVQERRVWALEPDPYGERIDDLGPVVRTDEAERRLRLRLRIHDAVKGDLHRLGPERGAIMELDVVAEPKRIRGRVRGGRPGCGQPRRKLPRSGLPHQRVHDVQPDPAHAREGGRRHIEGVESAGHAVGQRSRGLGVRRTGEREAVQHLSGGQRAEAPSCPAKQLAALEAFHCESPLELEWQCNSPRNAGALCPRCYRTVILGVVRWTHRGGDVG